MFQLYLFWDFDDTDDVLIVTLLLFRRKHPAVGGHADRDRNHLTLRIPNPLLVPVFSLQKLRLGDVLGGADRFRPVQAHCIVIVGFAYTFSFQRVVTVLESLVDSHFLESDLAFFLETLVAVFGLHRLKLGDVGVVALLIRRVCAFGDPSSIS